VCPETGISIQECAPLPFYCMEKISLKINRGEKIPEAACAARLTPSRWNRPPGNRVHQRRGVAFVPRFILRWGWGGYALGLLLTHLRRVSLAVQLCEKLWLLQRGARSQQSEQRIF
jgi:hypothetical protein